MEFKEKITIIGRISDIELELLASVDSYRPGTYFTRYIYTDQSDNIWWLDKESMSSASQANPDEFTKINNEMGNMWRDWQVIPADLIKEIKKH